MINAIIYDKVANTQTGQMNGEVRVVGWRYPLLGVGPNELGEFPKLEMIVEDTHRDVKTLVLSYSDGSQQVIPDRGVEKILKTI